MKNNNMISKAILVFTIGLIGVAPSLKAQSGKNKVIHTEKRIVNKTGSNDSTVTIVKEDMENGIDIKRTIVVRDGDTITNIETSENQGNGPDNGSSVIINGDSIVKIHGGTVNKNINIEKKSIIILNGDSVYTVKPGEGDVDIDVDTAAIRKKFSLSQTLRDVDKKGVSISDKYVVINLKKLGHKDSAHSHLRNVIGRIGLEGFDLGFTQFVDQGNVGVSEANHLLSLNVGNSVNVNFRVADLKVNLIAHQLYLDAGLEFDLHDYRFNNNVTIQPNASKFNFYSDSTANFSKDKLSTQYLELPLMICFGSNPTHVHHSFTIGAGAYGGILLGSYTKQVSDAHGTQHYYGDFHCNGIDYGFMGVIGYGGVQLYGKLNTSPLFQGSYGAPNLQSFTVGIRLFHNFKWS